MFNKQLLSITTIIIVLGTLFGSVQAAPPPPEKLSPADLAATPCPTPDPYEEEVGGPGTRDDSYDMASTLTTAGQPDHTFDRSADKDWAKFEAELGYEYIIATENLAPPYDSSGFYADTVLELYDTNGTVLLDRNDDYGGTYASRITWQPTEAGTYYVKVYNYNPTVYGCDVEYDLILQEEETLRIDKEAEDLNGAPLLEGDVIRYTITVTNPSSMLHNNVVITDPIHSGTTFVPDSASTSQGSIVSTEPVLKVLAGGLDSGETVTVRFDVQVDGDAAGQTVENQAYVRSDRLSTTSSDPATPPNGGIVMEGLDVSKTALDLNGMPVNPGDVISYTVTVTNASSIAHTNVVITDFIPSGTTYVDGSVTVPPGSLMLPVGDLLVVHWGTLGSDDTLQFEFAVEVGSGTQIGGNVVVVSSDQQTPQRVGPIYPPMPPTLDFAKQARDLNGGPLYPGDEILYTLSVVNLLDEPQTNVVITDAVPSHATYVPGSAWVSHGSVSGPDPLVASLGTLQPGEEALFTFRVTVDANSQGETIENSALADSDQQLAPAEVGPIEPEPGGGTVSSGEQALSITKRAQDANGGALYAGDEILYTVVVANLLDMAQTGIVITDAIPSHATYVAGSALVSQGSISGPDPLVVDVGTLQAGEEAELTFRVTVDENSQGETVQNSARASSDQQDPDVYTGPIEPEPSGGTVQEGQQALSITKAAFDTNGGPLYPGDEIMYTIVVANLLDTAQNNVVITDGIPSHANYVANSGAVSQGSVSGPDPLVVDVGTLAAGASVTFTFRVTVSIEADAVGRVVENVARAASDDQSPPVVTPPVQPYPDPNPDDPSSGGGLVLPGDQQIGIVKSATDTDGAPLSIGNTIAYTIVIWNEVDEIQDNVLVTDYVPAFTTYVSGSLTTTKGTTSGPNPLLVTMDTLAVDERVTVTFQVQVDEGAEGQTITNQAWVASDQQDPPAYTPPVTTPDGGTVIAGYQIYLPLITRSF